MTTALAGNGWKDALSKGADCGAGNRTRKKSHLRKQVADEILCAGPCSAPGASGVAGLAGLAGIVARSGQTIALQDQ
jgi:hypothetical protein